jgi:competence protein ComFC
MKPSLLRYSSSWKRLFFPRLCLHCLAPLANGQKLLCPSCFDLLELLDSREHCAGCLKEGLTWCSDCEQKSPSYDFASSCFAYLGPMQSLISEFKYNDAPHLALGLASFLYLQFDATGWPYPDIITFIPQTFIKRFWRGYNQSELLAKELSCLMGRPAKKLLIKRVSALPQSLLAKNERVKEKEPFFCIAQEGIEGKRILIIDDVFTTGTTVEQASKALRIYEPAEIYVLTISVA